MSGTTALDIRPALPVLAPTRHKKGGLPNPPKVPLGSRNVLNAYPVGRRPPVGESVLVLCIYLAENVAKATIRTEVGKPIQKMLRKAHECHMRTWFLKILGEHPRQITSEVLTQKCEIFL